ncbi:MAG: methionyl-tRNA formyltransferase [bacterium]|nr:methionyl-tRNA formyltransferase [bacterium]
MKIVFMGTPQFAVPSLRILVNNEYDIAVVVTVPDKKQGRGQKVEQSDIKKFALQYDLNILQPESLKDPSFIDSLKALSPDLIIVVAFRILPKEVFTIPKLGSFNLHGSLLPKYRGAAPINWAIINGDAETGVTTFFLKPKVDTGNIILQEKITIDPDDDSGTIHDKLSELGAETVLKTVKLIESGNVIEVRQDNSLSSTAPKIFKEDCLINWNSGSVKIHDFIRGLSPYPGAFTYLNKKSVKVYRSMLTGIEAASSPGKIIIDQKKIFVCTNDKLLQILELQLEGKKRVAAIDFVNGMNKQSENTFTGNPFG